MLCCFKLQINSLFILSQQLLKVNVNKVEFEVGYEAQVTLLREYFFSYIFGSCFRILAVILFQIFFQLHKLCFV